LPVRQAGRGDAVEPVHISLPKFIIVNRLSHSVYFDTFIYLQVLVVKYRDISGALVGFLLELTE
jgi:hypothetical protein